MREQLLSVIVTVKLKWKFKLSSLHQIDRKHFLLFYFCILSPVILKKPCDTDTSILQWKSLLCPATRVCIYFCLYGNPAVLTFCLFCLCVGVQCALECDRVCVLEWLLFCSVDASLFWVFKREYECFSVLLCKTAQWQSMLLCVRVCVWSLRCYQFCQEENCGPWTFTPPSVFSPPLLWSFLLCAN